MKIYQTPTQQDQASVIKCLVEDMKKLSTIDAWSAPIPMRRNVPLFRGWGSDRLELNR